MSEGTHPPVSPAADHDAFAGLRLERHPPTRNRSLKAYNGADRLLVGAVPMHNQRVLVVNDEHGALALACGANTVCSWTDSCISEVATRDNIRRNALSPDIEFVSADQRPTGDFRVVLLRVPKSLDLFGYQLAMLRTSLSQPAIIVTAGMDKHLSSRIPAMLEQAFGPVERIPGRYKAHCFISHNPAVREDNSTALPFFRYSHVPHLDCELAGAPGCFSREQLDGGARLILDNLHRVSDVGHVVDLGCGNGVLGLAVALQCKPMSVQLVDESAMAIASARENIGVLASDLHAPVSAMQSDGLLKLAGPSPDLILLNPPFHQQFAIDETLGWRLLEQSVQALSDSGRVWLVVNRHLRYDQRIKDLFEQSSVLASNRKFVLWELSDPLKNRG